MTTAGILLGSRMIRWIGGGIIRQWFTQHVRRGTTVPFEAPALRMARVCDDERDGLIAALHDFANSGTAGLATIWSMLRASRSVEQ